MSDIFSLQLDECTEKLDVLKRVPILVYVHFHMEKVIVREIVVLF